MTYTISQIAKMTGRSEATVRQHLSRGRLRASREGGRTTVSQADLDAYLSSEELVATAPKVRGAAGADVPREIGNMINRLPPHVAEAILDGIPTAKRQGGPDAFNRIAVTFATHDVPEESDDPHWGFPIGHQHADSPRWYRASASTWQLGEARWSWNGINWEGGGSRAGVVLDEGLSPAHPWSDGRPLAPPKKVSK